MISKLLIEWNDIDVFINSPRRMFLVSLNDHIQKQQERSDINDMTIPFNQVSDDTCNLSWTQAVTAYEMSICFTRPIERDAFALPKDIIDAHLNMQARRKLSLILNRKR